jgi:large subunit ribosomal protein L31
MLGRLGQHVKERFCSQEQSGNICGHKTGGLSYALRCSYASFFCLRRYFTEIFRKVWLSRKNSRFLQPNKNYGLIVMKQGIHPQYRDVVFKDISSDFAFKTRSSIKTKDTIKWEDGEEYPLVKLEVSSDSHPFFTGKQKLVDSAGRVDKFLSRYGDRGKKSSIG